MMPSVCAGTGERVCQQATGIEPEMRVITHIHTYIARETIFMNVMFKCYRELCTKQADRKLFQKVGIYGVKF